MNKDMMVSKIDEFDLHDDEKNLPAPVSLYE
jgi:hypothetical protein